MYGLIIDRNSPVSMLAQLTGQLRQLALDGTLRGGERLPPSRALAVELGVELGVARNTVVQVYEQLVAEGYLESRTGSGTYVAELAGYRPAGSFPVPLAPAAPRPKPVGGIIRFGAGDPDASLFPVTQWARCLKDACLDAPPALFQYGPAAGELPLRSAIAAYLLRSKGIACAPEHVLVIPGAARGVELLVSALAPGGPVAVEDPCIDFVQHILRASATVLPTPVDRLGMMPGQLPEGARLIYAVPSHQFPTGAVLPIGRRLKLLEHASHTGSLIVEDDYDSEFRYQGEPIQSLRHLDPERVVYLGTFSKILSPALRMGYLIAPPHLAARLEEAMEMTNLRTPALEQMALAAFLEQKLLDRHVYRMKKVYEKKRSCITAALAQAFGSAVTIEGHNAGMHLMATFSGTQFSPEDFDHFRACGVEPDWAEDYAMEKGRYSSSLVLGYGALSEEQIETGVGRLKEAISQITKV